MSEAEKDDLIWKNDKSSVEIRFQGRLALHGYGSERSGQEGDFDQIAIPKDHIIRRWRREVHQKNAIVIGKKPGQVEIRISFSEATSVAQAFVKERKSDSAENVGEKLKL
jgi:hypothetical protein